MAGRRRSDRALRGRLRSPGRPSVTRQEHRRRFWAFIAEGLSSEDAAMEVGVSQPLGTRWFRKAGGMAPSHLSGSLKPLSGRYLTLPNGRRSRCGGREVLAYGRSHVAWDGRHRRSRASCGATRRRGDAGRQPELPGNHRAVACGAGGASSNGSEARNECGAAGLCGGTAAVAAALNRRPRKTLRWKTPAEALAAVLRSVQGWRCDNRLKLSSLSGRRGTKPEQGS